MVNPRRVKLLKRLIYLFLLLIVVVPVLLVVAMFVKVNSLQRSLEEALAVGAVISVQQAGAPGELLPAASQAALQPESDNSSHAGDAIIPQPSQVEEESQPASQAEPEDREAGNGTSSLSEQPEERSQEEVPEQQASDASQPETVNDHPRTGRL